MHALREVVETREMQGTTQDGFLRVESRTVLVSKLYDEVVV